MTTCTKKISALNIDFNSLSFTPPPSFKTSSVREHQIWVALQNARFLLLSTNLAQQWLQIDTGLLLIITSTSDELSRGTN